MSWYLRKSKLWLSIVSRISFFRNRNERFPSGNISYHTLYNKSCILPGHFLHYAIFAWLYNVLPKVARKQKKEKDFNCQTRTGDIFHGMECAIYNCLVCDICCPQIPKTRNDTKTFRIMNCTHVVIPRNLIIASLYQTKVLLGPHEKILCDFRNVVFVLGLDFLLSG